MEKIFYFSRFLKTIFQKIKSLKIGQWQLRYDYFLANYKGQLLGCLLSKKQLVPLNDSFLRFHYASDTFSMIRESTQSYHIYPSYLRFQINLKSMIFIIFDIQPSLQKRFKYFLDV